MSNGIALGSDPSFRYRDAVMRASAERRIPTLLRSLVAGLLLLAGGCGDGRETLTLYTPHGRDLLTLLEGEYERLHPEVDLRWLDLGSQEVLDRLRSEAANPQADLWFGGPDTLFARAATEGLLAPYVPRWAEAVPVDSRHPEGLYHGLYRTPLVLVYAESALSPEEAPRDWEDLLAPRFRRRILIREPLASGTMRTLFGMVLGRAVAEEGSPEGGFAWLARLDVQTKEYVLNAALLHEKLVRGEGDVTLWDLTDVLLQRQRGLPLGYRFAASGTPVIDDAIAVVRGTAHPERAQEFIDWVGSREALALAAEHAYRLPARTDLDPQALPPWAREVLAEMKEAPIDWSLLEAQGADWMARWDREIRGRGAEWLGEHGFELPSP